MTDLDKLAAWAIRQGRYTVEPLLEIQELFDKAATTNPGGRNLPPSHGVTTHENSD